MSCTDVRNRELPQPAGYLTIFLALVLTAILSLLLTLIDGARRNAVRMQIELVQETAMESALSEFHRELLNQYDLLFIDTSYCGQGAGDALLQKHVQECMDRNFSQGGLEILDRRSFTGLRTDSVEITGTRYAADDNCRALEEQIQAYWSVEPAGAAAAEILASVDRFQGLGTDFGVWERQQQKYSREVDEMYETSHSRFDGRRQENRAQAEEDGYPADEIPMDDAGESAANSDEKSEMVRALRDIRNDVLLTWVTDDVAALSDKRTDIGVLLSNREIHAGTSLEVSNTHNYSRADAILTDQYIFEKCGNFRDPRKDGALNYQVEYILFGKEADQDNLASMVEKLLLVREAANLPVLLKDTKRCAEAETTAAVVCALLLVPEYTEAVKGLILIAWAGIESARDVETLLSGGKVPLIKTSSEWQTSLASLLIPETSVRADRGDESGLSYTDYLHIFLYLEKRQQKDLRLMDVMEMDIRRTDGNSGFRMDYCLDGFAVRAACSSSFGYQYTSEKEISYN